MALRDVQPGDTRPLPMAATAEFDPIVQPPRGGVVYYGPGVAVMGSEARSDDTANLRGMIKVPMSTVDRTPDVEDENRVNLTDGPEQILAKGGWIIREEVILSGDLTTGVVQQTVPSERPEAVYVNYMRIPGRERYVVDPAPIGRGGMGEVYRAWDIRTGTWVAVKAWGMDWVESGKMLDVQQAERLEKEAKTLARAGNPGVVGVRDFLYGNMGGNPDRKAVFMIMDYLSPSEYRNLSDQIGGRPIEDSTWIVSAIRQIGGVVEGLYRDKGILHRDLKPANIFFNLKDGKVVLTDFGISSLAEPKVRHEDDHVSASPKYAAPEVLLGKTSATLTSEVYSLGIMAYEMMTGRPPFGGTPMETAVKQVREKHPKITRKMLGFKISRQQLKKLNEVMDTVLEKDPEDRYQTPTDFTMALTEVLKETKKRSWWKGR